MRLPTVVGTFVGAGRVPIQLRLAHSPYIDIIEVRLDTFPWISQPLSVATPKSRSLLREIRDRIRKPILLTLRSPKECGFPWPNTIPWDDKRRMSHFIPLLPHCDLIDVEIRHWPYAKFMTALARRHDVDVIHSYHQFEGQFQFKDAARWAKKSQQIRGDIFKVAMTPHTNHELEQFLSWGMKLKNPAKVLIGMGKVGEPSRFLAPSFGSVMTYGHLGTSAAPGQMAADKLGKAIRDVYGTSSKAK